MSLHNLSSAHSDDGQLLNRVRRNEQVELDENRITRLRNLDDATRLSVTAEISDHGNHLRQRPDEEPISE